MQEENKEIRFAIEGIRFAIISLAITFFLSVIPLSLEIIPANLKEFVILNIIIWYFVLGGLLMWIATKIIKS